MSPRLLHDASKRGNHAFISLGGEARAKGGLCNKVEKPFGTPRDAFYATTFLAMGSWRRAPALICHEFVGIDPRGGWQ